MADVKYSEEHEWIRIEGDTGTIGITQYAQEQLGDVVFVEVPAAGRKVAKGEAIAVVESVKAASDIYAPVSGEVVESNAALADSPATSTPNRWARAALEFKLSNKADLEGLMDEAYAAFVKGLG